MKKVKLFSFALAALMLGACSSEDVIDNGGQTVLPGEKGYISLSINLPTTTGTRVTYDDGTPDEYAVKNAKLLIFAGSSETDAICQGIYDLNVGTFSTDGNNTDQITSTARIVQEITKPNSENLYALVVLNDNGLVTNDMINKSFSSLYTTSKTLEASDLSDNGFFMTNAPLYSVAGGTNKPENGKVTTLSTIDASKVYTTEAAAEESPATTVYVERALSKVTLTGSTNLPEGHNANITGYSINGWTLDNTNTSTYLVRNVAPTTPWWTYQNGDKGYRFVDGNPVKSGVSLYRTHFGIDPNYNTTYNAGDYNSVVNNPSALTDADGETPEYCLENTFDVANMRETFTTRVVIAAKLNVNGADAESGDFYVLNNNTNVIYNEDGVLDAVKSLWMNYLETIKSTYIASGTIEPKDVTVTLKDVENGGIASVASIEIDPSGEITYQQGQSLETLKDAAKAYVESINDDNRLTISYYKGGVAYYTALIKHFGDSETPWDGTVGYNSDENDYLGRYGVLRNTWYQLTVTGLKNIGSPEVPAVTTDFDDPGTQYISVDINILPWAKRTQNVDL